MKFASYIRIVSCVLILALALGPPAYAASEQTVSGNTVSPPQLTVVSTGYDENDYNKENNADFTVEDSDSSYNGLAYLWIAYSGESSHLVWRKVAVNSVSK